MKQAKKSFPLFLFFNIICWIEAEKESIGFNDSYGNDPSWDSSYHQLTLFHFLLGISTLGAEKASKYYFPRNFHCIFHSP